MCVCVCVCVCVRVSPGDKELVEEVLFDAVVTAPLEAYWTSLVLNKSEYVHSLSPSLPLL